MQWTPEMRREQLRYKQVYGLDKVTKKEWTKGIEALNALIQKVEKGESLPRPHHGICANWYDCWQLWKKDSKVAYNTVFVLSNGWDHPMRSLPLGILNSYPIQWPQIGQSYWEGDQREARIHLMRYVVKRLRDWRRRAPE